jgi:hypothetical protein
MSVTNVTYCTQSDRSRPSCCRTIAMSSRLAPGSTRSTVGSPVRRTNRKMVTESKNSDTIEYPRRWRMNRFIS